MALAAAGGSASYDQNQNTTHLDLSDALASVLNADCALLGRIPMRGMATNVDHYWVEDALNSNTVTANEGAEISAAETTLTIVSNSYIDEGALLMDEAIGKTEVMQVVTVTSATEIVVVRAVGDSAPAAETHAAGAVFRIIGQPKQENDEQVLNTVTSRSRKSNICQIFKKEVNISGTQQAINKVGVPNEYQYQLGLRTLELRRDLGNVAYLSVKISAGGSGGSDSVYRSMDGLRNTTRAGGNTDATSTAFTEGMVNALYRLIWNDGGEADTAAGSATQITKFAELHKDKIRLSPSDRARGTFVTKFLTDIGVELDLLVDRWILKGDLFIGDMKRVSLMPLQGRAWHAEPLAKVGDGLKGMIIGEYTIEQRNAGECFALASALTE